MDDRRLIDRQRFPLISEIELTGGIAAQTTNISNHGLGILGQESIPVGNLIDIVLMNRNVVVKGTVRHVAKIDKNNYRIGVEFDQDESDLVSVLLST